VAACSRAAWQLGVRIGMPLAEATSLAQQDRNSGRKVRFHIEPYNTFEDHKALEELAVWCHQFSPLVGLAEEEPLETLLLDVTGIAPLFGGEQALNQQIETAFLQQHLTVRMGLGNTVGAAWALAHYACRVRETHRPQHVEVRFTHPTSYHSGLLELPVEALRLPPAIVETLTRLGLERVGDLIPLPRNELKARFGTTLLQRLDQALGKQPEVISQVHSPSEFMVEWIFEHPVTQQNVICQVIEQLITRLCFMLLKQDEGSLQLSYRLTRQDLEPVTFEVGCYRPSADANHLWKLTQTQLERLVLRNPVTSIVICATRHARLSQQQKELFDDDSIRRDSLLVASLIDRMAGRLGRQAIVRCVLQSDPQPENAFRYEPLVSGALGAHSVRPQPLKFLLLDRPLHLPVKPVALESVAVASNGSPSRFQYGGEQYTVSRHWGPERIETGWWRQRGVRRDYYRVETMQGFRFWMFRSLRDDRWFLHGAFD
jgi:protein ImuB